MMRVRQHEDGCPLLGIGGGRASMEDVLVGSANGLNYDWGWSWSGLLRHIYSLCILSYLCSYKSSHMQLVGYSC